MGPVFQPHPIPQNVTNFEFHLVGDMTLKQFGYLAGGLGFAFVVFTAFAVSNPILAWPIIIISSLNGVAFAFLPIQERPLDHWVSAFFKAIFKPTKLKFESKLLSPQDPFFKNRLSYFLNTYKNNLVVGSTTLNPTEQNSKPQQEAQPTQKKPNFMERFRMQQDGQKPVPAVSAPVAAKPISHKDEGPPKAEDLKKTVELAKEAQDTQAEIIKIEGTLTQIKNQAAQAGVDPKKYVEEFQELLTRLQKLNEKASKTAHDLALISNQESMEQKKATVSQSANVTSTANPPSFAPLKREEPVKAKSIPTLKLTTFPNVINGIVTDSQGNYIEGAIIVAHDKQGLPVRALKSNKLGQFVAATPLTTGEYTIVVEKDQLVFDKVSVDLKNDLLPAVMISAKKVGVASA